MQTIKSSPKLSPCSSKQAMPNITRPNWVYENWHSKFVAFSISFSLQHPLRHQKWWSLCVSLSGGTYSLWSFLLVLYLYLGYHFYILCLRPLNCNTGPVTSATFTRRKQLPESRYEAHAFEKGLSFIYSDFHQNYNTNDLKADSPQMENSFRTWGARGTVLGSLDVSVASSSSSHPSLGSAVQWLSPLFPTTYTATIQNYNPWAQHT